ncbi:hypothetical protein HanIR_Chr04g0154921 [Helianthus annuus]|nr:hypothetical protein HanIR_Chr04g0154921 [Helianthus annuus]
MIGEIKRKMRNFTPVAQTINRILCRGKRELIAVITTTTTLVIVVAAVAFIVVVVDISPMIAPLRPTSSMMAKV